MRELILLLYLIICLGATGASVPQPRGQRRTGSLPLVRRTLYDSTTSNVSSGPEFVAALRNATIGCLQLVSQTVDVPWPTWNASGEELPIVLSRNVTIEGDPGLQFWPALRLHFIQGTVRLAHGITLEFRHVVIDGGRRDNPTRAPGLDMLKPTLGGEFAALVLNNSAMTTVACFPPTWQQPNLAGLKRPPWVAGTQLVRLGVPQVDCVNDTDVPYMHRCWVDKTTLIDLATLGADSDSLTGGTLPNNMVVLALNFSGLCRARVDEGCLSSGKEPLVCYLAAVSSIPLEPAGARPRAPSGAASVRAALPMQGGAADVIAAAPDPPPSGLSGGQRLAVTLSMSLVGGVIVVLLVAAAVVVAVQRRRSSAAASSCSKSLAAASAAPGGAPPPPCSATLMSPSSCNSNTIGKDGPAYPARLYRVDSSYVTIPSSLFAGPAPAAGEAGGGGVCSRNQDSMDEEALQQSHNDNDGHVALRTGAGAATKGRDSYNGPSDCDDCPVTPYTPHRPSLMLGVALTGATVSVAARCCEEGGMPFDARNGGMKVCTLDSAGSFTLVDSSAALSGGVEAVTAATAVSGDDALGGGSRESVRVVELSPVVLGKGAYGRVHEGAYGGRRVAVKVLARLHPGAGGDVLARSFAQEVQVLGRCQHPNIVRLLAAALEPPSLCLVMELMETSLEKLLHGDPSRPLMPMLKVLHIAIAVANALAYLHPTIVHRDLKPANVLIDNAASDRPTVKISDFGLSRLRVTVAPTENPEAGTPAYMAPECFDLSCNCITHQADMFSFGVLVWEMLSGERPWWKLQPVTVALMVSHHGTRLPMGPLPVERRPDKLTKLLAACWDADPTRRPAAAEVAKKLALLLQEYALKPPPASAATADEVAAGGGPVPGWGQPTGTIPGPHVP